VAKKMTREQEKRAKHPGKDEDGDCTRCGVNVELHDYCPPGFWMTEAEVAAWCRGERVAGV